MEHRDGETLVWPDDCYHCAHPIAVLSGHRTVSEMKMCVAGYDFGHEEGQKAGEKVGFRSCQAGLRAPRGAET